MPQSIIWGLYFEVIYVLYDSSSVRKCTKKVYKSVLKIYKSLQKFINSVKKCTNVYQSVRKCTKGVQKCANVYKSAQFHCVSQLEGRMIVFQSVDHRRLDHRRLDGRRPATFSFVILIKVKRKSDGVGGTI